MVKILVDYFADQATFLTNFEQVRGSQTDFDTVVINNIPTLQTASNLINNLGFEQEIIAFRKVQAIVLRINEKIDENFNQQLKKFRIKFKNGILVAFQSTLSGEESKTYWQLTDDEKYFSIYVNDDHDNAAVTYLHNFILGQMNVHRNGIISTSSQTTTNLDLNDIGDENGNNLLYLAVKDNNLEAVVSFLSKGLDPEGNESSPAIDAAWAKFKSIKDDQKEKSKIEKIMKLLLNANSRFPTSKNWYEDEIVPQAVKDFLEKRENLQRLVDHPDFNKLSEDMSKDDNLIFYYNRHNESFLVYGLRINNYKILSLMKEGLSIGSHEEVDQVYYEAESVRSSEVCKENIESSIELPNAHLLILQSKSRILKNDQKMTRIFTKKLIEAWETIDNIDYCSKILKVAASWNQIKIHFDCSRDNTMWMDYESAQHTKAKIFNNGRILIGAKNLFDENEKFLVFGAIIHELCHAAVLLIYRNNFNPYNNGSSDDKLRYKQQVIAECVRNKESDVHVGNVLALYRKVDQPSEFIVTYPQILVEYLGKSDKIMNFNANFNELIKYSQEVTEPEFVCGLSVIKMLQDDSRKVTFNDLTKPLQVKILNSEVVYKDLEFNFQDLYDENPNIVNQLTSNGIKDFLLKSKEIVLTNNHVEVFERRLLLSDGSEDRFVVICSFSGSGMSTFLKSKAQKLKKDNKGIIVSYINLNDHKKHFDDFMNNSLDIKKVVELFGTENLRAEVRAIYLLDGLDQIWTKYGEFWLKVFKIIKQESKIELWISATPRQTKQLEDIFNIQAVKFASLTDDEIRIFIKNNLKIVKTDETAEKILEFLKYLETPEGSYDSEMNNLSLIKDITSLYNEKETIPSPSNLYEIFSKIDKIVYRKFLNQFEDCFNSNISIQSLHEGLALKTIFGDNYKHKNGFKVNDLVAVRSLGVRNQSIHDFVIGYGIVGCYQYEMEEMVIENGHNLKNGESNLKNGGSSLKNENPNLKNENPNLKNENPNLKNENPNLKNENPKLKNENPNLKNENPNLKNENPNLKNENPNLKNENPNLKNEEYGLKIEKDNLKNGHKLNEPKKHNLENEIVISEVQEPEVPRLKRKESTKFASKFGKFNPKYFEPKLKATKSTLASSASNIFTFASNVSQGISNFTNEQSRRLSIISTSSNLNIEESAESNLNAVQHNLKINEIPVQFIHKSFVDFFVAKFIVDFVTGNNSGTNDKEVSNVFKLLEIVAKDGKQFLRIREFINSSSDLHYLDDKIIKLANERIAKIHNKMRRDVIDEETLNSFEFFAKLFKNDDKMELKLWNINKQSSCRAETLKLLIQEGQQFANYAKDNIFEPQNLPKFFQDLNIFEKILYPKGELNINYALNLAEYCFGLNWHEKLNQTGEELAINTENVPENFKNDEKIQKLCSFVDKNFEGEGREKFYKDFKAINQIYINFINHGLLPNVPLFKKGCPPLL